MKVARFALILYLSASSEGFQGQYLFGGRRPVYHELSAKKKAPGKKKQALIFGSEVTLNQSKPLEVDFVKGETLPSMNEQSLVEAVETSNRVADPISLEKEAAELAAEASRSAVSGTILSIDADAERKQRSLLSYRLSLEAAQIADADKATRVASEEEAARIAAEEEAAVVLALKKAIEAKQRALLNRRLSHDRFVFEKRFGYAQKLRARQAAVEEARSGTPESIAKYRAIVEAQESLADKCFTVLCSLGMHDEDDDVPDPDSEDYDIIHGHVDEKPWHQISANSDFFWEVPPELYLEY